MRARPAPCPTRQWQRRAAELDAAGGLSASFDSIVSNGASVTAGHDATSFYVVAQ